jgi:hypothetical protein
MGHGAWGMGHGEESPMPYAQSQRAAIPLQTPGDGVSRRLSMRCNSKPKSFSQRAMPTAGYAYAKIFVAFNTCKHRIF